MELISYLKYVCVHKYYVFLKSCKLGIPWLGLVHDWHKFLPDELFPYARFFYGIKQRRNSSGYYKPTDTGNQKFEEAWLKHVKRSKHHWQAYVMPQEDGTFQVYEMPIRYRNRN